MTSTSTRTPCSPPKNSRRRQRARGRSPRHLRPQVLRSKGMARTIFAVALACANFSMAAIISVFSARHRERPWHRRLWAKPPNSPAPLLLWACHARLCAPQRTRTWPPRTRSSLTRQRSRRATHANTANLTFPGIEGEALHHRVRSQRSACSTGQLLVRAIEPSHVLTAIGMPPEDAAPAFAFSLAVTPPPADVAYASKSPRCRRTARQLSPAYRNETTAATP